jgi:hypothetical protein
VIIANKSVVEAPYPELIGWLDRALENLANA